MQITRLNALDIAVIAVYFAAIIFISVYYARRAGHDLKNFFLSGRDLPWYLAGTAMVATTFAADTPLAVTELVAQNGIAGNWLWWNMAIGGMFTVFFFARLWRRAGVMTDLEFVELRYSGREAAVLRGFRALYLGLFMNIIVLGWVHTAMEKIFQVAFPGVNAFWMVAGLAVLVSLYASAAGLLGTIRTDSLQFVFALTGCIILAVIVVNLPQIGGMTALKEQLSPEILSFFPLIGDKPEVSLTGGVLMISVGALAAYVFLQWWSAWYPGNDPGGGGYVAQRMMSAKNEKHSLLATLWFNIAHYTLRPWPWIIVALCALVLLPRMENKEALKAQNPVLYEKVEQAYQNPGLYTEYAEDKSFAEFYETYENTVDPGIMYPKLMVRYLPAGLLGLLISVFMAAYMSTIASQLNWGTSYLVNDFYKRFIRKESEMSHYVRVSRVTIVLLLLVSLLVSKILLTTVSGAWIFIINASAGLGGVLILRWYWWRINAWSEISAMIAPLIIYPLALKAGLQPPITLFPTVLGTTAIWVAVTFLTSPVKPDVLGAFYKRVHPGGPGWRKYEQLYPAVQPDKRHGTMTLNWILGVIAVYAALYGIGKLLFAEYIPAIVALAVMTGAGVLISVNLNAEGKN